MHDKALSHRTIFESWCVGLINVSKEYNLSSHIVTSFQQSNIKLQEVMYSNTEKHDKKVAMDLLNIPKNRRGMFMKFANRFGTFNYRGDNLWYEYSPLEDDKKIKYTMAQMWEFYLQKLAGKPLPSWLTFETRRKQVED